MRPAPFEHLTPHVSGARALNGHSKRVRGVKIRCIQSTFRRVSAVRSARVAELDLGGAGDVARQGDLMRSLCAPEASAGRESVEGGGAAALSLEKLEVVEQDSGPHQSLAF